MDHMQYGGDIQRMLTKISNYFRWSLAVADMRSNEGLLITCYLITHFRLNFVIVIQIVCGTRPIKINHLRGGWMHACVCWW